jgi:hypothetical protein
MMIITIINRDKERDTQQDRPDQHRFSGANKKIGSWST